MSELTHYGILGMKWGVRKDPNRAYKKASKKLRKLDTKLTNLNTEGDKKASKQAKYDAIKSKYESKKAKTDARMSKLRSKADRANYKADTAFLFGDSKIKKANKANRKVRRYQYKVLRDDAKFQKALSNALRNERLVKKNEAQMKRIRSKAIKWYKSMEKEFRNTTLTDVDQVDIDLGKKYMEMLTQYNVNKS